MGGEWQVSHSDKCGKEHLLTRTRILTGNDTYLGGYVTTAGVLEETLGIRDMPLREGFHLWLTFTGSLEQDAGCTNANEVRNITRSRDVSPGYRFSFVVITSINLPYKRTFTVHWLWLCTVVGFWGNWGCSNNDTKTNWYTTNETLESCKQCTTLPLSVTRAYQSSPLR